MKIKLIIIYMIIAVTVAFTLAGCGTVAEGDQGEGEQETWEETETEETSESEETKSENFQIGRGSITAEDINLHDIYGGGSNYVFTYRGEDYTAIYYYDNWCVYDSYKITNSRDMKVICQALIDEHPIHGSDYESYRTADDMVYEWKQHNLAHSILPEDNAWKTTTGNVDFDPEDQGKSMEELYESRTGEEFNLSDHKDDLKEYIKNKLE